MGKKGYILSFLMLFSCLSAMDDVNKLKEDIIRRSSGNMTFHDKMLGLIESRFATLQDMDRLMTISFGRMSEAISTIYELVSEAYSTESMLKPLSPEVIIRDAKAIIDVTPFNSRISSEHAICDLIRNSVNASTNMVVKLLIDAFEDRMIKENWLDFGMRDSDRPADSKLRKARRFANVSIVLTLIYSGRVYTRFIISVVPSVGVNLVNFAITAFSSAIGSILADEIVGFVKNWKVMRKAIAISEELIKKGTNNILKQLADGSVVIYGEDAEPITRVSRSDVSTCSLI